MITALVADDWPDVAAIFEQGIASGQATFETAAPGWRDWDGDHLATPRLVARRDDEVVGWAALSPVSGRCVYHGVAEVSLYVATHVHGQGVGRALLERLVDASEQAGLWTLQAGVFPENAASIAVHGACGFRTVGVRERLGRLGGVWRDVVLLERRSPTT